MATRSLIGNYRSYIYCHWDGYPSHNGEILKKYYKDPKKVDELISLGDISVLAENVNPDTTKPHNFEERQEDVVIAYHRDRGENWEDVKPMVMSKEFEAKDTSIEYIYYFDDDKKLWKYKELYADNPQWIWLKDEEDIILDENIDNTLRDLATNFIQKFIDDDLEAETNEQLDEMIEEIEDEEIQKSLKEMDNPSKTKNSEYYSKFQNYVKEEILSNIENEKISEYIKKEDINLSQYDNNLTKFSEYYQFLFKLDKASNNINQKGILNEVLDDVITILPDRNNVKDYLENPDCANEGVEKLTWNSEGNNFYEEYQEEINELLADDFINIGTRDMVQLFGDSWNEFDPLALADTNQNLLAWYGYEEVAHKLYTEIFEN